MTVRFPPKADIFLNPRDQHIERADLSDERAGMRGQAYCMGNFHCGPDDAETARTGSRHARAMVSGTGWPVSRQ